MPSRLSVILILGSTQTLAWGSSYYLPAILADPISRSLDISSTWFFAAFSASLLIAALIGPRVGRTIDTYGGREVLAVSNIVIAAGLVVLGLSYTPITLAVAWLLLGVGMGLGLYDSAFAMLGRIYGMEARSAITGISLLAGFASTIGWPLTALGAAELGWRNTCFAWAAVHILIGLPLNRFMLPKPHDVVKQTEASQPVHMPFDRNMALLAFAFAAGWMVVAAMAAHLPRLLEAAGATTVQAVAAGALIGPAQVAARIAEASILRNQHPIVSARLSMVAHRIGVAMLALFGAGGAAGVFAAFHGAGSGIMTIARGTVPLAIFGPDNYGYRLGLLGAPARMAQAVAPLLFGLLIDRYGAGVLTASVVLSLCGFVALMALR
ncbi:MAG: MFS transporter, partial [Hyphomicrobium sp.]|nr:MFS transporter [Hyphomicrobium sp.]